MNMNYYPYGGYQPRRSGSGGGCECAGGPSVPAPYQAAYHMPMSYQPSAMPMPINHPAPSQEVLRLLEESVAGEKEDRIFYQQLIELAPTTAEKEIIAGIRDDEISHFAQFRLIYRELTGNEISSQSGRTPDEQSLSYIANLRKALFGEMAAVKRYRTIRAELTSKRHRDMLFNIITDELTHMGKYNYLITINKRS
ncbi:MAG: ferritin-like domain-containing protein [Paenibacillaceae bacterium]